MKIEILFFEGCPNANDARVLVYSTVEELGIDASVELVLIHDQEEALSRRFLGSPSIRIDGRDFEFENEHPDDYGMKCRMYKTETGMRGIPDRETLANKLRPRV